MDKIYSVSVEHTPPTLKDAAKAVFAAATGRFDKARALLSGETRLIAKNIEDGQVFSLSGGNHMTVVTRQKNRQDPEPPKAKCRLSL